MFVVCCLQAARFAFQQFRDRDPARNYSIPHYSFCNLFSCDKFSNEKLLPTTWACKNRNVYPCKHYSKNLISHLQCRWMLDWRFFRIFLVSEIPILKGHNFRSLLEWIKMQNAIYKMSAVAPPLLIYILCHLYFACPPKPKQIKMRQRQF